MKKFKRLRKISVLCTAGLILAGMTSLAAEKFTGRVSTGGASSTGSVLNFKVSIEKYSKPEEIRELARILSEKGFLSFITAFRGTDCGTFQLPGLSDVAATIHATNIVATDKGRRIQLFFERRYWDKTLFSYLQAHFTVVELDIDAQGRGTGRIFAASEMRFSSGGNIEVEPDFSVPWVIFGLKRIT